MNLLFKQSYVHAFFSPLITTGQIDSVESLFTYPVGTTAANFSFPDHIPAFLDEVIAGASPEVLAACGENIECIFDASQTGNISVGLATMETNEINNNDQMQACKKRPSN